MGLDPKSSARNGRQKIFSEPRCIHLWSTGRWLARCIQVKLKPSETYYILGCMKPERLLRNHRNSQELSPRPTVARQNQSPRLPTWSLTVTTGSQHHRPPAGSIPGDKGPWTHKGNNDTPDRLTFHMLKYVEMLFTGNRWGASCNSNYFYDTRCQLHRIAVAQKGRALARTNVLY